MSGMVWIMSGSRSSSRLSESFLTAFMFQVVTSTRARLSGRFLSSSSPLRRPLPFRALSEPTRKLRLRASRIDRFVLFSELAVYERSEPLSIVSKLLVLLNLSKVSTRNVWLVVARLIPNGFGGGSINGEAS